MKKDKELNIIRPDAKRRITIDSIPENISSYKITREGHGTIILEAYKEVPLKESPENPIDYKIEIQQES